MKSLFFSICFIFFIFLSASCGGEGDGSIYEENVTNCNGVKVDYDVVCNAGLEKNCSELGDYDNIPKNIAKCKNDCTGWDTSLCSKCGDGVVNGTEACDGQEVDCSQINSEVFDSGTAICNNFCTGWVAESCSYIACRNGGVATAEWVNSETTEKNICLCSPTCKVNVDCDTSNNEICIEYDDIAGNPVDHCVINFYDHVEPSNDSYSCIF